MTGKIMPNTVLQKNSDIILKWKPILYIVIHKQLLLQICFVKYEHLHS